MQTDLGGFYCLTVRNFHDSEQLLDFQIKYNFYMVDNMITILEKSMYFKTVQKASCV